MAVPAGGGQRLTKRAPFSCDQLYGMGLHQLRGSAKYPAQALRRSSLLSRVPEDGTHGLKGDGWKPVSCADSAP